MDEHVDDVDVDDAIDEERKDIEESRSMPKWLVQTLHDSKLSTPLSSRTCLGSHHASYTYESYDFAASNMCDKEEPISFDEALSSKNWMVAMQVEYDAIIKNGTWYLIDLPHGKKAIGTK